MQCTAFHSNRLRTHRGTLRSAVYLLTTSTARRRPLFTDASAALTVVGALRHYHEKQYVHGFAWVVMPDHIHWLMQLRVGSLAFLMRAFKTWTSRNVRRCLAEPPPMVWQPGFHDRLVRPNEPLKQYIDYVVLNPVRAELVEDPRQYPYVYGESEMLDIAGAEPKPIH